MKKEKLNTKSLGIIDLVWQATLFLGIITATAGVRKFQSEWKYEKSIVYVSNWYQNIKSELNRYRVEAENGLQKSKVYNWKNEDEYSYLIGWYMKNHTMMVENDSLILENLDIEKWKELQREINNSSDASIRFHNDAITNLQTKLKWIDEEIYKTYKYKEDRFDSNFEHILFLLGPWVLSIVLGVRIAITYYRTFIYK